MTDTSANAPASARERTRSRENTRARLLDAAAQVFAEVGLGEASVEAICERAGFTRGAFYSNFESKDEMFLELAKHVAQDRVAAVRARIDEINGGQGLHIDPEDTAAIVDILDAIGNDRLSGLLMQEITIHAMRDREFAAAYVAQEREMVGEVVQLIEEIRTTKCLSLRVPSHDAARMILAVWSDVSARAAIAGVSDEELSELRGAEVGRIVQLLLLDAS
ncbi:TetR/AcrR family transcriptional regulator [Microbacterium marinilacus]|uniref:TetR/AcrR family transcriptional regulator n=1 Tax=Microbacterium marinilacus TaxID=415209 RepID=A0ABP7BCL9_9MICO|nr:TetR/AcrR family transcriptional regulator [Microbacterium marinilacus]MBY0686958.1 TetR/AcrR family transcriptional regulator [Microbacterium marinilacus]